MQRQINKANLNLALSQQTPLIKNLVNRMEVMLMFHQRQRSLKKMVELEQKQYSKSFPQTIDKLSKTETTKIKQTTAKS